MTPVASASEGTWPSTTTPITAAVAGSSDTSSAYVARASRFIALLAGIGVGISSSVIPYVFDQLAMKRLARATYALLVSLLPATAAVIGVVVLGQVPSLAEATGVMLVIGGVALHRAPEPAPAPAG